VVPSLETIAAQEMEILLIVTPQRGIEPIDLAGKQSHALVPGTNPVERDETEGEEVLGLDQLWQDREAVERGVGGVVGDRAIVVGETGEPGVFDSVTFRRAGGQEDSL